MGISANVRDHWLIALQRKIAEQKAIHEVFGEHWSINFDPNDIAVYQIALDALNNDEKECYAVFFGNDRIWIARCLYRKNW